MAEPRTIERRVELSEEMQLPAFGKVPPGTYVLRMVVEDDGLTGATVVRSGDLHPEQGAPMALLQQDLDVLARDPAVRVEDPRG